ncbi:MAG TPA: hypothetical protein DCZ95_05615 [Verrucomicrobia bacterium]|nr:MAG: hypothetical protein A2X46_10095 [Lentisphaerae bacterium GWF2_57_35]HBA83554.1 hypothetical protein [Verrucomicrobiota bacterium]
MPRILAEARRQWARLGPHARRWILVGLALFAAVFWGVWRLKSSLNRMETGSAEENALTQQVEVRKAGERSAIEAREARIASVELARQTLALRRDLAEARQQVRTLSEALAEARAEADLLKLRQSKAALGDEGSWGHAEAVARESMELVDVNEALGLVVIDAGRADGLRPGMLFSVMREQKAIARVRVADVRDTLSGAVIEDMRSGGYPKKGDRLVFWKQPGR